MISPCKLSPHSSDTHTAHHHTLQTLLSCTCCPTSYSLHTSQAHIGHRHTLELLSCTYGPLSYSPHIGHCHTFHMPLAVIPFALLSCIYYPPSCPSNASTARSHALQTLLLHILAIVLPSTLFSWAFCPHFFDIPLLHIWTIILPSTIFSPTYYPQKSSWALLVIS